MHTFLTCLTWVPSGTWPQAISLCPSSAVFLQLYLYPARPISFSRSLLQGGLHTLHLCCVPLGSETRISQLVFPSRKSIGVLAEFRVSHLEIRHFRLQWNDISYWETTRKYEFMSPMERSMTHLTKSPLYSVTSWQGSPLNFNLLENFVLVGKLSLKKRRQEGNFTIKSRKKLAGLNRAKLFVSGWILNWNIFMQTHIYGMSKFQTIFFLHAIWE